MPCALRRQIRCSAAYAGVADADAMICCHATLLCCQQDMRANRRFARCEDVVQVRIIAFFFCFDFSAAACHFAAPPLLSPPLFDACYAAASPLLRAVTRPCSLFLRHARCCRKHAVVMCAQRCHYAATTRCHAKRCVRLPPPLPFRC